MTKTSNMLPTVAAVLPAEKGNETPVKWGLLPCCRFSGPLSINMTFLEIVDHLSLRPSGLKGRFPLHGQIRSTENSEEPGFRPAHRICRS